jgi:hypothetical protein
LPKPAQVSERVLELAAQRIEHGDKVCGASGKSKGNEEGGSISPMVQTGGGHPNGNALQMCLLLSLGFDTVPTGALCHVNSNLPSLVVDDSSNDVALLQRAFGARGRPEPGGGL